MLHSDALCRHRLVRVFPAAWDALLDTRPELADERLLRGWARRGWPLIVRRWLPTDAQGIPLGIPLPPALGKRRVAVQVALRDLEAVMPLPTAHDVLTCAPVAWQPSLRAVANVAERYQVHAGVFGSLGWQWLTGLDYVSPKSDVDIAWQLPRPERLAALLAELTAIDARSPVRLDGELVRPDGAGANWREWQAGGAQVAVKTSTHVCLQARQSFLDGVV